MPPERTNNPRSVDDYYARNARRYDLLMRPFSYLRAKAIHRLDVFAGARVLELGCGTGTSFRALVARIGPTGRLLAVDRSCEMLSYARQKAGRAGWRQVTLIQAEAEDLALERASVDRVLAFYTNDIFCSERAIAQAVAALCPKGRFVIAGAKLTQKPQRALIDRITRLYAGRSIRQPLTTQPWQRLEQQLGRLTIEEYLGGSAFLAYGTKAGRPGSSTSAFGQP